MDQNSNMLMDATQMVMFLVKQVESQQKTIENLSQTLAILANNQTMGLSYSPIPDGDEEDYTTAADEPEDEGFQSYEPIIFAEFSALGFNGDPTALTEDMK